VKPEEERRDIRSYVGAPGYQVNRRNPEALDGGFAVGRPMRVNPFDLEPSCGSNLCSRRDFFPAPSRLDEAREVRQGIGVLRRHAEIPPHE